MPKAFVHGPCRGQPSHTLLGNRKRRMHWSGTAPRMESFSPVTPVGARVQGSAWTTASRAARHGAFDLGQKPLAAAPAGRIVSPLL